MIGFIVFGGLLLMPFFLFLVNAARLRWERQGMGRPGPAPVRPKRKLRVVGQSAPAGYCGRTLTHLALRFVGAEESCRYCRASGGGAEGADADVSEAVAAAERIIDDAKH